LQSSWTSIKSNREQHLASWKLKTYKNLLSSKTFLWVPKQKTKHS
jgi:hypothetical protein